MLVRVYGRNATIDLFDHHLVITHARSGMFSDPAAEERFIPLSSILAVQVSRPTFGSPGKFVLTLAGGIVSKPGTAADPNTVFFDKTQTAQVQAIVDHLRQAIATPSLEQLAMAAQRQRQASAPPPGRQITPTQAVLERIDPPKQSYNPNTGADYRDTSSAGYYAYNYPGPMPSGGGSWWSDMPLMGKLIAIAAPIFALLIMCSGKVEHEAPGGSNDSVVSAQDEAGADQPAPSADASAEQALNEWAKFVTGQEGSEGFGLVDGPGHPGQFCNSTSGKRAFHFGGTGADLDNKTPIYDFFGFADDKIMDVGAFRFDPDRGELLAHNLLRSQSHRTNDLKVPDRTIKVKQISPGVVAIDGIEYHSCLL